ncbi:hypothetical protein Hanom_Chr17g01558381 [Helianthus anomalus]
MDEVDHINEAPPLLVDPLHGHAYMEFTPTPPKHRLCYFILVDSWWHSLFAIAHTPSYRELLVEFLSTFTFYPPRANQPPTQPHAPPLHQRFLSGFLVFGVRRRWQSSWPCALAHDMAQFFASAHQRKERGFFMAMRR